MADLKQLKILGTEVITADKDIVNIDNITCSGLWVASGQSGQLLRVNSAENALEYSDPTEIPGLLSGVTIDTNKDWQGYDITNLDLLDCNSISLDGATGDCTLATDTGRLQITNTNGYLYIGPNNGTWCHFYTGMSAYYFDKPVDWAGDMRPYTDNGYSLGSLTRGWANLYLMTAAYMNDTLFMDSSRNLSNIGTVSCGDITVIGSTAYSPKIKFTNPTLTPSMESGYAMTSATDSDTVYCNLIDYGVNYSSLGTVDSSLRGGVFRVDGRKNYALFQWNYRAPSGSNTVIATMNEAGAMSVGGLTTSGDINLNSAGANIQVQGANAKRTIILTAGGGIPTTTAGCASAAKTELATNDVMITTLDFDQTTSESAQWNLVMPDNWDAGTLTARFYWTASGGTAAQTVIWGIQGRSYADDEALDQAPGTAVTTSDAYIAANDLHISGESSAITITGATAGEFVVIKVYRDISDTLASDAKLLAVKLEYGISAYSD